MHNKLSCNRNLLQHACFSKDDSYANFRAFTLVFDIQRFSVTICLVPCKMIWCKLSQHDHVTDSYKYFMIIIIKGKRNFFFIVNSYNVIIYDNDRQTLHPDKQAKYTRAYSWIHHGIPVSIQDTSCKPMQQVEQGLKNVCTQDLTQVDSNVTAKPYLRCRMYQGINRRYI